MTGVVLELGTVVCTVDSGMVDCEMVGSATVDVWLAAELGVWEAGAVESALEPLAAEQ